MMRLIILLASASSCVAAHLQAETCNLDKTAMIQDGAEAVIGVLFSAHNKATRKYGCGNPKGMQQYESLRYVLDLLNKKDEWLNGYYLEDYYVPGIRLGVKVVDICGWTDAAIGSVSSVFPSLASNGQSCSISDNSSLTLGFIASSLTSDSTFELAKYLRGFSLPVIADSAAVTDEIHSGSFPNLLRTVSPDINLLKVIGEVMQRLNWKYVVVVYEKSFYGMKTFDAFRPIAFDIGICITKVVMVTMDDISQSAMRRYLEQIVAVDVTGVVYFGSEQVIFNLLHQGDFVPGAGKLQWIVTDSVSLETKFSSAYPKGIISITHASRFIVEFEDHWVRVDEENPSVENPWYKNWFMFTHHCNLRGYSQYEMNCSSILPTEATAKERQKRMNFVQDAFVEPMVLAVYTYAHALLHAQRTKCGPGSAGVCQALRDMQHDEFLTFMRNVDFTFTARERIPSLASDQYAPYHAAKHLGFDSNGDIVGSSFSIWNYNDAPAGEENTTHVQFREVGNHINGHLSLHLDRVRMYSSDRQQVLMHLPESLCPVGGCFPCLHVPEMKYYYHPGDLVIHGIFSLHGKGEYALSCGDLLSLDHLFYMQAMIYAINMVNRSPDILPHVTLGGSAMDDCMDSHRSMDFIMQVQGDRMRLHDAGGGDDLDPRSVEAYLAAHSVATTVPVATLMHTLQTPMVGYHATSKDLNQNDLYITTVPNVDDELRAVVMILSHNQWNYTHLVTDPDIYGHKEVMLFRRLAAEAGVCIVSECTLANAVISNGFQCHLGQHSTVSPVVLLMSEMGHRLFMTRLNETEWYKHHNFVASSTFKSHMSESYEHVADGYVSIDIGYSRLNQFFSELDSLDAATYLDNPWFEEWYEATFRCFVGDNPNNYQTKCPKTNYISSAPDFRHDTTIIHVINAVYAIARGLDSVLVSYCGSNYTSLCPQFVRASRKSMSKKLMDHIMDMSFDIEDSSPTQEFKFVNRGGGYDYNIYQYMSGHNVTVGMVDPHLQVISLGNLSSLDPLQLGCPEPCLQCLHMFNYQKHWYIDGDLIIPAVIDIHHRGVTSLSCGALRASNGVQYTEAFKFALDYVNGADSGASLGSVKLGGLVFDGCSNNHRASAIISGVMRNKFTILNREATTVPLSSILLPWLTYDSHSTMDASSLLEGVGMPIIGPAATSPHLLDKDKYATFFRTIPSDGVLAQAMAFLVKDLGKPYIIVLNDPDATSRETSSLFRRHLQNLGVCVILNLEFQTDGDAMIILKAINDSSSHLVAVFAESDTYVREMLHQKFALHPAWNDLVFVFNRYWPAMFMAHLGLGKTGNWTTNHLAKSLSFRPSNSSVPAFINYLERLSLNDSMNPFLPEYYQRRLYHHLTSDLETLFRCNLGASRLYGQHCADRSSVLGASGNVFQHLYTLSTINAVHAIAVAVKQTLERKCGVGYASVCSSFLYDSDTMQQLMEQMDSMTFTDITDSLFDFVQREPPMRFEVVQYARIISPQDKYSKKVADVTPDGKLSYQSNWDPSIYDSLKSECQSDCLKCGRHQHTYNNFSYIDGDLYVVGLFDVHLPSSSSPFNCGAINLHQGSHLLEAFNAAIYHINEKRNLFSGKLKGVRIGAIGVDVCRSPTLAASLVANIQSGKIPLTFQGGGHQVDPRRIVAYVGPFDTQTSIRVAEILGPIGVPQITYGATGLELQDVVSYPYFLRSVPADDKQARAIISYLKNFNLTEVLVISSMDTVGRLIRAEFTRLASLNRICIMKEYFIKDIITDVSQILQSLFTLASGQTKVIILLLRDPLSLLRMAGHYAKSHQKSHQNYLWVATDKWGFIVEHLIAIDDLMEQSGRTDVVVFEVETADVRLVDEYLDDKTPDNYNVNPWFTEFYESVYECDWYARGTPCAHHSWGIPRADSYVQDPYVLYVVNAVFSVGLGIDAALRLVCTGGVTDVLSDGVCLKFEVTGDRRDVVLNEIRKVHFMDDSLQPFFFETTGESSRGYHIYNVTKDTDRMMSRQYRYENIGSYNDTHSLKMHVSYGLGYEVFCLPHKGCYCENVFPASRASRYMLHGSTSGLNMLYIGDIHRAHSTDPFSCGQVEAGLNFFKMMAFFYAINRINSNTDNLKPESLQIGGVALDTCSSTIRLDQDIFNLLNGYPLCDSNSDAQVVLPSSIVAFIPDGNQNSIPVSHIAQATDITAVSPSSTDSSTHQLMSHRFLSIVPPDDVLAVVLLEMMTQLDWDYISLVYTEDPDFIAAKDQLLILAAFKRTVCVGQALAMGRDADLHSAEVILGKITHDIGVFAVVLFTSPAHSRLLLQAAAYRDRASPFVWVATSFWDEDVVRDLRRQASGALLVVYPQHVVLGDFVDNFITRFSYVDRLGLPDDWFDQIYQSVHRCRLHDSEHGYAYPTACTKQETIDRHSVPSDPGILHTIIAVSMVASGLNRIPDCHRSQLDLSVCVSVLSNRHEKIFQAVKSTKWNSIPLVTGENAFTFSFNENSYGNIQHNIYNYHSSGSNKSYIYTKVGSYVSGSLQLNMSAYRGLLSHDGGIVPSSKCVNHQCHCQRPLSEDGKTHRWIYTPPEFNLENIVEGRSYIDPATGQRFFVEKIPDAMTRFNDIWGVAMATMAAIGVFLSSSLFVYMVTVYPVRGGTSVLGFVLLFGIIPLYGLVFAFITHPIYAPICHLRRFGLGFCYSIVYCPLFVKLTDCWRSLDKPDPYIVKYDKLASPTGLFMVTCFLIMVQVMINTEWLILETSGVTRIFYNSQYWPRCTPSDFQEQGLVLSLCYVIVIIALIVVLGLLFFNSTKNHWEARWILGMAMLSIPTWVGWCTWFLLGELKTRDAAVCVGILVNASILLLLGPVRKLYLLNKYRKTISQDEQIGVKDGYSERAGYDNALYDMPADAGHMTSEPAPGADLSDHGNCSDAANT